MNPSSTAHRSPVSARIHSYLSVKDLSAEATFEVLALARATWRKVRQASAPTRRAPPRWRGS